jgi:hypothetical protein
MSSGGKVAVGFCYAQTTQTPQWRFCYQQVLTRDAYTSRRVVCEFGREASGVHVPDARSKIVAAFLAHPARPDWLWIVDTDATFPDDTLERLIASADPKVRPIVGALAFGVKPRFGDWSNRCLAAPLQGLPTLFTFDGANTNRIDNYPPDQLVQVHATGAHCLLVHRSVLADKRWIDGHPSPWFRTAVRNGEVVAEDNFFCTKAGSLGFPIYVDTAIKTGHVKSFIADEDWFRSTTYAPPATEPTAVLVPVMLRPQNAAPFMASLRASTSLATAYAVADLGDCATQRAWADAGAEVLISERGSTFAQKINHGYLHTTEALMFVAGDDVVFRPGWLDQAQHTMRTTGADVVGTNDLLNPRVLNGDHATHMLISRSYVDELGASWPALGSKTAPKLVCHEAYTHCFVDDEIVTVAKQRGAWAPSTASIVEHLHPLSGKAADDDVYRLGQSHFDRDRRVFDRRCKEFG